MASISFQYPFYLFFLFLIPLYIFIHLATLKLSKSSSLKFANFEAISKIKGVDFFSKNIIILILSIFIITLMVFALSGMTFHTVVDSSKHSFIIALDTSQSMEAKDILPSRIESAKRAAINFIDILPSFTKVGIISFSGNALIEQDLTDRKDLMKNAISQIKISGISGTDINEAVITSSNLLKGEEVKAVILLSDGQVNVGGIEEAILYANNNEVLIHTIAFGTEEGGETSYGISKLDEDSLKALAYNSNGQYFRSTNEAELEASLKAAIEKTRKKVGINIANYLLIAASLLFTFEYFLINSRYKRLV